MVGPAQIARTLAKLAMSEVMRAMRYEARLTAFDMLDQVHVSLVVLSTPEEDPQRQDQVLARTTTVPGEGRSSAREWTQEALIAMLEDL